MLFKLIFHVVGEQLHVNFVFPHIRLIVLILSSLKRWFSHLCQEHVTNLALDLQPKPIITSAMIWKDVLKLKHISINVKKCKVVSSNIPKGIPNLGIKNFKMSWNFGTRGLNLVKWVILKLLQTYWILCIQNWIAFSIGDLKQKLWPIEWSGIKLAIQFQTLICLKNNWFESLICCWFLFS